MGLTRIRAEQISNIDYKQAVRVVATAPVTLSGGAPNQVDNVNLNTGDRILVTGQSTASQNGLYDVQTLGSGSNGTWVRTPDGNETGEISAGMIVMVTEGLAYADTTWKLITDNPITIGSTALEFIPNPATSFSTISANGTAVIANAATSTLTLTPGNNFVITGNNSSDTITFDVTSSPSFIGNVIGGNILTAGIVSATGNITGSYILGNGSQLTGIDATSIQNGTSNVRVANNSNVTVGIAGTSNVGVFTTTGLSVTGEVTATGNITGGNVTTGLLTVNTGVTSPNWFANYLFIGGPGGALQQDSSFSANTTSGNLTVYGNLKSLFADLLAPAGNVIVSGNVIGNLVTGTLTTAAQPNITSVGTLLSLSVSGATVANNLQTTGNAIIGGNLIVNGNTTYINITDLNVQDPLISLGGGANGAPLTTNDGKDRGELLEYYTTTTVTGFIGLKNSTGNLIAANSVSVANNIITVSDYGTFQVGQLYAGTGISTAGNVNANNVTTGIVSATGNVYAPRIQNGGTGITIDAGYPGYISFFNSTGQKALLDDGGSLSVVGNVYSGNISVTGNITGNYLFGNGSQLTGLSANSIGNIGNCSVVANTPDGNVNISADGVANLASFNLGTMTMLGAYANPNYIDISISVIGNVNGMMVGPIAFGPTGNIQVPSGSRIVIL